MKRARTVINALARALVDRGKAADALPRILSDGTALAQAFSRHPELRQAFERSSVPSAQRQELFRTALSKGIHPYVLNAFLYLLENRLMAHAARFMERVRSQAADRAGHLHVRIASSSALSDPQRTLILSGLRMKAGASFDLTESVKPELGGGLVVDIGDTRMDGSFKGRIDRLHHALQIS